MWQKFGSFAAGTDFIAWLTRPLAASARWRQLNRAPQALYTKLNHSRRTLAECVQRRLLEDCS